MPEPAFVDDRGSIAEAERVTIDWPEHVEKPRIGIVQDYGQWPRWTKYCQFLERNALPYDLYNIHSGDWLEKAAQYDAIVGCASSEPYHLEEMRRKYHFLETYLDKVCYPSLKHAMLYEDKSLEAYLASVFGLPYAKTYISHDKDDAMRTVETMAYPVVYKIVPSSGSLGMELVRTQRRARQIVEQAFSRVGRKTHYPFLWQKDFVYFQEYVPNDGYDIRVEVIGNKMFGYYRKVLEGDFRASGMHLGVEKRVIPEEVLRIALRANEIIQSPLLAVDMVHGLDGKYRIIEFSPISGDVENPEELKVNGVTGVYVVDDDGVLRFQEGKYWIHELVIKEFLLKAYLSRALAQETSLLGSHPATDAIRPIAYPLEVG